eukprot:SAG31_NODE_4665_length_3055_cov_1.841001_2_plen_109_part_00
MDAGIAIKSGRDWSGRLVNISTRNVLAENNYYEKVSKLGVVLHLSRVLFALEPLGLGAVLFACRVRQGHGVSIGSETSGWVYNVTIRDSVLHGTNLAVSARVALSGRG